MTSFTPEKAGDVEAKYIPEDAPLGPDSDTDRPALRQSQMAKIRPQAPWILSLILLVLLAASWKFHKIDYCSPSSFERGFELELAAAKSHIRIHKVKYRGTPQFASDGEEYGDYMPGEVRYVGKPSEEINEAWNELTKKRFFLLSVDEARAAWGYGFRKYWNDGWGGYAARRVFIFNGIAIEAHPTIVYCM